MAAYEYFPLELFCRCLATRKHSPYECYVAAGFPEDREIATELSRRPKIIRRINEIDRETDAKTTGR